MWRARLALSLVLLSGCTACTSDARDDSPSDDEAGPAVQGVSAAQLTVKEPAPVSAKSVLANGAPMAYGFLRDGTLLLVWLEETGGQIDNSESRCRLAYSVRTPRGATRRGRLPDNACYPPSVRSTPHGFLVGEAFRDLRLISRQGRALRLARRQVEPLRPGDVGIGRAEDGRWVVARPETRSTFRVRAPAGVVPVASADSTVWGIDASGGRALRVVWSTDQRRWQSRVVARRPKYVPRALANLRASGSHAWVSWCLDSGNTGCRTASSVTDDRGATWQPLRGTRAPHDTASLTGADATGDTLMLMVYDGTTGRRQLLRSVPGTWTRFSPTPLPRAVAEPDLLRAEDRSFSVAAANGKGALRALWHLPEPGTAIGYDVVDPPGRPAAADEQGRVQQTRLRQVVPDGDGALLLTIDNGHRATRLSRLVTPRGSSQDEVPMVAIQGGVPGPDSTWGLGDSRFLRVTRWSDPLAGGAVAVAPDGSEREVEMLSTPIGETEPDDVALVAPGRERQLAVYRDGKLHVLPSPAGRSRTWRAATVDPAGRVWALRTDALWSTADGGSTWTSAPIHPRRTDLEPFIVAAAGGTTLVALADGEASVRIELSGDSGRTWRVPELPRALTDPRAAQLLSDGRLLLGPHRGRYWRATNPTNTAFDELPAGPIRRLVVSGPVVYALPFVDLIGPELDPIDRDRIWMSQDSAQTWVPVP